MIREINEAMELLRELIHELRELTAALVQNTKARS